jgi:putative endonuclease
VFRKFLKKLLRVLDRAAPARDERPTHLVTGERGEEIAHFYLREQGYTIVARNWRVGAAKGELDLVGWEGDTLCFVEVKTRTSRYIKPAEAAVDEEKRRHLREMARRYMKRLEGRSRRGIEARGGSQRCRFDIVSLYLTPTGKAEELTLFRNAFPMA